MLLPEEIEPTLSRLQKDLEEMRGYLDLDNRRNIVAELEKLAATPDFWNNQKEAQNVIAKTNAQKALLKPYDDIVALFSDAETMYELAKEEPEGDAQNAALAEVSDILERANADFEALRVQSLLTGPLDRCNAFLTLHAGAGGTEACDWTSMLQRMYMRYCERAGFTFELMESTPGDEAGIATCTFAVKGLNAYGYLKAERGIHRLVRISPFDSNARRHTSFASLDVIAELEDDIKVDIKPEDLEIDTFRSGGAGGQHVNKTESAIRLTHLPTGIVVACQDERSQTQNKEKAFAMLRTKLYDYYQSQKDAEYKDNRKSQIGTGDRSERIRTYNFPQGRVTDHRIGLSLYNILNFMDGDLDEMFTALATADQQKKLAMASENE